MKNNSKWKTLESKIVYQNPWMKVREDKVIKPDGSAGIYGVVEAKSGVMIVAINDKKEIIIQKLYRYTLKRDNWEIPSGGIDEDNILDAAKRELQEETGFVAKKWEQIGTFASLNGLVSDVQYVFLAQDLMKTDQNSKTEEGIIESKFAKFEEILEMIRHGDIDDSQSITSITLAKIALGQ